MTIKMNPLHVTKENIWEYAQNKPSLIADDLARLYGVPRADSLKILMARGVFKWLNVRRNIIAAKDRWKKEITWIIELIKHCKKEHDIKTLYYLRGYLRAMEDTRKEIRAMCHSERWSCPDFDQKSLCAIESGESAERAISVRKDGTLFFDFGDGNLFMGKE